MSSSKSPRLNESSQCANGVITLKGPGVDIEVGFSFPLRLLPSVSDHLAIFVTRVEEVLGSAGAWHSQRWELDLNPQDLRGGEKSRYSSGASRSQGHATPPRRQCTLDTVVEGDEEGLPEAAGFFRAVSDPGGHTGGRLPTPSRALTQSAELRRILQEKLPLLKVGKPGGSRSADLPLIGRMAAGGSSSPLVPRAPSLPRRNPARPRPGTTESGSDPEEGRVSPTRNEVELPDVLPNDTGVISGESSSFSSGPSSGDLRSSVHSSRTQTLSYNDADFLLALKQMENEGPPSIEGEDEDCCLNHSSREDEC